MTVSVKQTAKAVTALKNMRQEEQIALCDEIFERQPDVFFVILGLSQEGMSPLGAEYALQQLLVIYSAMRDANRTKRVTRDHLNKGIAKTDELMGFLQGGFSVQEGELAAHSHSEVNLLAFVVGDMKEQGLLNGSKESCDIFFALKTVLDGYVACDEG